MDEEVSAFGNNDEGIRESSIEVSPPPPKNVSATRSSPKPATATINTGSRTRLGSIRNAEEQAFVDEFGFELSDDEAKEAETVYVRNMDGERVVRREVKWKTMAADWGDANAKNFEKIKSRCRKGIPAPFRGQAWQYLTGSHFQMTSPENKGVYEALKKKRMDPEMEGIIERDLGRTFPTHVAFKDEDGEGQKKLRSVLRALACIDPEVGYVQGMGFIAATLLTQMGEEESFWCLHAMLNDERYRLRDMYRQGFPMLQLFFFQLKHLSLKEIPKLQAHFDRLGVDPSFFAAQWFLTLFVYHFQFRALLRVWDIFMCEGWKIVFRCALALMKWEEKLLLSLPFDRILPALKALHEGKNPDEIVERSLKIKFKTEELAKLRARYDAGER